MNRRRRRRDDGIFEVNLYPILMYRGNGYTDFCPGPAVTEPHMCQHILRAYMVVFDTRTWLKNKYSCDSVLCAPSGD